jgi:response regulator RpfG family c-di-GMP phosphodiesterase
VTSLADISPNSCIQIVVRRLLVLIVEVEQPEGLSSRKLIIESMKHNVVTAYSGGEALDLLARLRPDIVLIHKNVISPSCKDLVIEIQRTYPDLQTAVLSPTQEICSTEDHQINSLEPTQLVRFFKDFSQKVVGTQPMEHSSTKTVTTAEAETVQS